MGSHGTRTSDAKVWAAIMSGDHDIARQAVERHQDRQDRKRMRKNHMEREMWEEKEVDKHLKRRGSVNTIIHGTATMGIQEPENTSRPVNRSMSAATRSKPEQESAGIQVSPLFDHIFIKAKVPKKIETCYQKCGPNLIPILRYTRGAPSRRELGFATYLRNSTTLTRNGANDPRITTDMLMKSMMSRQKVVKAAERFIDYSAEGIHAASHVSKYNRKLAGQITSVMSTLETSTLSLSAAERAQCFPLRHSNDMLTLAEKKWEKRERIRRRRRLRRARMRKRRKKKREKQKDSDEVQDASDMNPIDAAFMKSNM